MVLEEWRNKGKVMNKQKSDRSLYNLIANNIRETLRDFKTWTVDHINREKMNKPTT